MWEWLERQRQRDREIRQGADADLFRDNRRRWKLVWCLFACAFLFFGIESVIPLSGRWHSIAVGLTIVCFAGGVLLGQWARAEQTFLERPDPKEPPRLWK